MKRLLRLFLVVGLIFSSHTLLAASAAPVEETIAETVFTELEKQAIERYYRERFGKEAGQKEKKDKKGKSEKSKDKGAGKKEKELPPGLAKKESLPPGLAKQLERNGQLPPGLEKRNLPSDLSSRLPKRLPGQKRVIVDNDVVLIEEATGLILDVLKDVF